MRSVIGNALASLWQAVLLTLLAPNFWRGAVFVAGFWAVAYVSTFLPLYTFTRIALMVLQINLLGIWLIGTWRSFIALNADDGDRLAMGLWIFQFGSLAVGVWALIAKITGSDWMQTSDVVTFLIAIQLLGAALQIASPGSSTAGVAKTNWIVLLLGVTIGATVTAALMIFGPELLNAM